MKPDHPPPPLWQRASVAAAFCVVAAGLCFSIWRGGRPVSLPDAAHAKLECASYTPSHNGHTLSVADKRALVASDLRLLSQRFRCVRTYSVSEGLDDVPRVAREVGLKVMLGLWISSHAPSNDKEIARGIELANQHADVVEAVIVGNEVLLRREQTPGQLRALIDRVRAGTSVPVTYADVWEFWMRNADLAHSTHFVTVHILPYWEDHPIGIDRALDHVSSIYAKVVAAFPGKRVLIGETGWPSVGRPRLDAVPSSINQARFVREFVAYAEQNDVPYNLIEAFDQPWKRIQEGTVGGYWGVYDADGAAKFTFTGAITPQPQWRVALSTAVGVGALFTLYGFYFLRNTVAILLYASAGTAAGAILFAQWQYLSTANRTALEWAATTVWAILGWLTVAAIAGALARWMNGASQQRSSGIAHFMRSWGHDSRALGDNWKLGLLRFGLLACTAYVSLALAYDGRGRDFPIVLLALPAFGLAVLELVTQRAARSTADTEEWLLASVIGVAAVYIAWNETATNIRAMTWCGLSLLLSGTAFAGEWRAGRFATMHPHQRAEQQSHTA